MRSQTLSLFNHTKVPAVNEILPPRPSPELQGSACVQKWRGKEYQLSCMAREQQHLVCAELLSFHFHTLLLIPCIGVKPERYGSLVTVLLRGSPVITGKDR